MRALEPMETLPRAIPPAIPLLVLAVLAVLAAGCRLDILRVRAGTPIDEEEFEALEVDRTTREEVMEALGAPEKVEWKSGDDYVWYLYADTLSAGLRFQFPPFRSLFGYQHTFLRLDENSEEVNALQLVFDESGVLRDKSLRLSDAYSTEVEDSRDWRLHVSPHGDYSIWILGDGGFRDHRDLFRPGYRAGLHVGYQPFPILVFVLGGNYQRYGGRSVTEEGVVLGVGDLELFQLEVGFRFEIPLAVLVHLGDFDEVKRLFFEEDPDRSSGLRLYVQGTTGGTWARDVPIDLAGAPLGDLYRRDLVFSGGVGIGLEYEWAWGAVHAGVSYQGVDALENGDSPLDGDGDAFEALLAGGGVSLKF